MKFESFIGVDVSKLTLDVCLVCPDGVLENFKIENKPISIKRLFIKIFKLVNVEKLLVCAEYTGHYSNVLKRFCLDNSISLCLESGAEIKLRSGIQRKKNDKIDSERIADYAIRYQDKLRLYRAEDIVIEESKLLISEREMYIRERAKYKAQLKDLKGYIDVLSYKDRSKRLLKHILVLTGSITLINKRLDALFEKNEQLKHQKKILISINGVGPQVALHTIVATHSFTKFDNGRQFACHSGVAPFSFESGSSQRSRNKVSNRANKKLKTLLHMAALSAIQIKGEFKEYYERKVAEGKNKMTVINAVRAKIIHRMFALIRDNRTYQQQLN